MPRKKKKKTKKHSPRDTTQKSQPLQTSRDLKQEIEEEIEALKAIFNQDVKVQLHPKGIKTLKVKVVANTPFSEEDHDVQNSDQYGSSPIFEPNASSVVLSCKLINGYPLKPPKITLEKPEGITEKQVQELIEMLESECNNKLLGNVMVFNLHEICKEYLEKHSYSTPRKSMYDEMIDEKNKIKKEKEYLRKEVERKQAEEKKKHDEMLRKELEREHERKKNKIKQIKLRKKERLKTMYQSSFVNDEQDVDLYFRKSALSEYDISKQSSQSITTSDAEEEEEDTTEESEELSEESDVEEEEEEEEGEEESEEDDNNEDKISFTNKPKFDIVFGTPKLLSSQDTGDIDEQQKYLLVHLLRMFCQSYLPNDKRAYNDLVEQLQKIGILDDSKYVTDFNLFKKRFTEAFREQINNSSVKGKIFSTFWTLVSNESSVPKNITTSRYRSDFIRIARLGKGGFGSVVLARNKLDQRLYAIKKIPLPSTQNDVEEKKILREVNLLSRLHHTNVVRYYSAWREETNEEDDDGSDDDDDDEEEEYLDTDSGTDSGSVNQKQANSKKRMIYIQMEYCDGTLQDVIDDKSIFDGKEEANRLFRQILEGLSYMHKNEIIHRDLKPANIFFSVERDIKIGDFGLATTLKRARKGMSRSSTKLNLNDSLQVPTPTTSNQSLSTGVGTPIYQSPEQESGKEYSSKVDMYALGLIYLEMLLPFETGMERIMALTQAKETGKVPENFPVSYSTEAKIIEWLLQKDPEKRPSCQQLMDSGLIPMKMEEQYLRALFARPTEDFTVGNQLELDKLSLKAQVISALKNIFYKHGALPFDISVFLPNSAKVSELSKVDPKITPMMFKSGQLTYMSSDLVAPFARFLSRTTSEILLLKRFSFDKTYKESPFGVPDEKCCCSFDIIGSTYMMVADAEVLKVISEITSAFSPTKGGKWVLRINHSGIIQAILDICKVPPKDQPQVCAIVTELINASYSWKYIQKQLSSALNLPDDVINALESFFTIHGDATEVHQLLNSRFGKNFAMVRESLNEMATIVSHFEVWPMKCKVVFDVSFCKHYERYSGILFHVGIASSKKFESIAYGGRYDKLVSQFTLLQSKSNHVVGACFKIDKLVSRTILTKKITRHFAPGELDVFVCSDGRGMLDERMRIVNTLWNADIAADLIYDDRIGVNEIKEYTKEKCIKWLVITKPNLLSKELVRVKNFTVFAQNKKTKRKNEKMKDTFDVARSNLITFLLESGQSSHEDINPSKQILRQTSKNISDTVTIISDKPIRGKQKKLISETATRKYTRVCKNLTTTCTIVGLVDLTLKDARKAVAIFDSSTDEIDQFCKSQSGHENSCKQLIEFLKRSKKQKMNSVFLYTVIDDGCDICLLNV